MNVTMFYIPYAIGSSPFKHPLTPGDHAFKAQPRECGNSRRTMWLRFELATDGTMINPTITDVGPV